MAFLFVFCIVLTLVYTLLPAAIKMYGSLRSCLSEVASTLSGFTDGCKTHICNAVKNINKLI